MLTSPPTTIRVVGAAIIHKDRCLIAQRSASMALPGKWEFPGGKVEEAETPEHALAREIEEELGIRIKVGQWLGQGSSADASRVITLEVYAARWISGTPAPREHACLRWVQAHEFTHFDWAEADVPVLPAVEALLKNELR